MGVDIAGEYANATELMPHLAQSEEVAPCVTRQWMRFALSRPEGPEDESSIAATCAARAVETNRPLACLHEPRAGANRA